MATAGYKTRVLLGDFSLSPKLSDISLPHTVDMLDVTTFADDGVRRFIPGLASSTASMTGFLDADTLTDVNSWSSLDLLTFAPFGLAAGSQVKLVNTYRTSFETGAQVAGVAAFDVSAQVDGYTDFGVSLSDLTAYTSDTNGATHDGTAATSSGAVAHLHITAYSGLTDATVTVEDSANASTWATIGTFATATAVTAERLEIAGTIRRYTRIVVDVTGTGSVTLQASLARR